MSDMETKLALWLANGRVGASSKTMAFWLGFDVMPNDRSHPLDPSDFNRCLLLLDAVPELRKKLPEMAKVSPTWARLVSRWDEVEETFLDEVGLNWCKARSADRTYKLMNLIGC